MGSKLIGLTLQICHAFLCPSSSFCRALIPHDFFSYLYTQKPTHRISDSLRISSTTFPNRVTVETMVLFRSFSRSTVHEESPPAEEVAGNSGRRVSLTVWRKSLVLSCNGFTVIDCNGNIAFRVDNYMIGRPHQIILMDGFGKSLLTMRRQKLGLLGESWSVYEGEVGESRQRKKPTCRVRKNTSILHVAQSPKVVAHVYNCRMSDRKYVYSVEGSYGQRSCKVLDAERRVVAEVKRKEAVKGGVCFGAEVFLLLVLPGFDSCLAMALVLILDRMFS